jgi:Tfp pilus assembly protein PilF
VIVKSCQSIYRVPFSLLAGLLVGCALAAGCADAITFSKDARVQGIKLYGDQNYADAAGAFQSAIRQQPRDYINYYDLGRCYDQMGQWHEAIAAYRNGWEVSLNTEAGQNDNKFRARVIDALAGSIARSDTRDLETATAVQKAHERQSGDDYLLLAKVYAYRGDADSAIDCYSQAAMIAPGRFDIAKEYGLYLEKLNQEQRAKVELRRAYALNGGDAEVNAALRRVGIVPGPGLDEPGALAKPIIPEGPIPSVDMSKIIPGQNSASASGPRD